MLMCRIVFFLLRVWFVECAQCSFLSFFVQNFAKINLCDDCFLSLFAYMVFRPFPFTGFPLQAQTDSGMHPEVRGFDGNNDS